MSTTQSIPTQGGPAGPGQGVQAARGVQTLVQGAPAAAGVPASAPGAPHVAATARGTLPAQAAAEPEAAPDAAQALPDEEAPIFEPQILRLPVELDVVVAVRNFRVRNLLALQPEAVIESLWANGEDLPLAAGAVRVAWGEFEVVDNQLALRVTRLD